MDIFSLMYSVQVSAGKQWDVTSTGTKRGNIKSLVGIVSNILDTGLSLSCRATPRRRGERELSGSSRLWTRMETAACARTSSLR